jgi:hypothetical protein
MFMVKAVKAGHKLEGVSEKTSAAVERAAHSMTDKQVADFAHVAKKPKFKKG